MGKHVRPIRAWAEYDTWSIYMADLEASTWDAILIPTGLAHWQRWLDGHGVTHIAQLAEARLGIPLRSLRVLYENGYELRLALGWSTDGPRPEHSWWLGKWPVTEAEVFFAEDKDSEAVERAMIAAATWFTQAEGLDA